MRRSPFFDLRLAAAVPQRLYRLSQALVAQWQSGRLQLIPGYRQVIRSIRVRGFPSSFASFPCTPWLLKHRRRTSIALIFCSLQPVEPKKPAPQERTTLADASLGFAWGYKALTIILLAPKHKLISKKLFTDWGTQSAAVGHVKQSSFQARLPKRNPTQARHPAPTLHLCQRDGVRAGTGGRRRRSSSRGNAQSRKVEFADFLGDVASEALHETVQAGDEALETSAAIATLVELLLASEERAASKRPR